MNSASLKWGVTASFKAPGVVSAECVRSARWRKFRWASLSPRRRPEGGTRRL